MSKGTIIVSMLSLFVIAGLSVALFQEKETNKKAQQATQEYFNQRLEQSEEKTTVKTSEPPNQTQDSTEKEENTNQTETTTTSSSTEKEESEQPEKEAIPLTLLKDFAFQYINYETVQDRNKALLRLTSETYQKENGLKNDLNIPIKSTGEIKGIWQSNEKGKNVYLVQVTQATSNSNMDYMLEVTVKKEGNEEKVDRLIYHLYKNAY